MILRRLATFSRLGWRRQALFLEALALVSFAWAATHVLPFRWVRPLYGRLRGSEDRDRQSAFTAAERWHDVDPVVRDVRWALHTVHIRLSWDRSCLARAIAGRIMLRRRGYSTTLYIGAYGGTGPAPQFHALLLERGAPVTGVRGAKAFTTLAVFDGD